MTPTAVLTEMVKALEQPQIRRHGVIHWSAPVVSFGDPMSSTVATLGLNPSNREFVDARGRELDGPERRFPTLRSLGLSAWTDAHAEHLAAIETACRNYFRGNPYDLWFRRLDALLGPTGASFYGDSATACHLDLVPYATSRKWGSLGLVQRRALLAIGARSLALSLRVSQVRVIVMNGASVVRAFEQVANVELASQRMAGWALPRRVSPVDGVSYRGRVTSIAGISIGREVHVLGYNHNIQSSFGVTTAVVTAIGHWLGRRVGDALR